MGKPLGFSISCGHLFFCFLHLNSFKQRTTFAFQGASLLILLVEIQYNIFGIRALSIASDMEEKVRGLNTRMEGLSLQFQEGQKTKWWSSWRGSKNA